MPDPKLVREGNLRLACLTGAGWPADPLAVGDEVRRLLAQQDIVPYGAVQVFIVSSPDDEPPAAWECHAGCAVTGMPRPAQAMPGQRLLIEDYRDLVALTLSHHGPVRELGTSWRRLADHARSQGSHLRPYWRVALRHRQLADGSTHPLAEVSVFLDR